MQGHAPRVWNGTPHIAPTAKARENERSTHGFMEARRSLTSREVTEERRGCYMSLRGGHNFVTFHGYRSYKHVCFEKQIGSRRTLSLAMIDGRKRGLSFFCRIFGSVIPRALPWGILGAVEGYVLDASNLALFRFRNGPDGSPELELWHHPYSVHVFGMVIGFALVMRVQIAYARFWEGATNIRTLSAKLADSIMQIISFDEMPPLGPALEAVAKGVPLPNGAAALPAVFDEAAFDFRLQVIHFASLFHALSLIEIRLDEETIGAEAVAVGVNTYDPYLFRVRADPKDQLHHGGRSTGGVRRRGSVMGAIAPRVSPEPTITPGGDHAAKSFGSRRNLVHRASQSRLFGPPRTDADAAADDSPDPDTPNPRRSLTRSGTRKLAIAPPPAAPRMPSITDAAMPIDWKPEKPVPLQQVIRARRRIGELTPGCRLNSVTLQETLEEEGEGVQPRSCFVENEASTSPASPQHGRLRNLRTRRGVRSTESTRPSMPFHVLPCPPMSFHVLPCQVCARQSRRDQ